MNDSAQSPTASPDLVELTAPLLFGPLFNWALYGILVVQIFVYNYNFPKDRQSLKLLAYFVFVSETVQTALTGSDLYYWFVAGFGNVGHLENSHFGGIDNPIITAIVSLTVQGYFCHRIWSLNGRSSWICWVIAVVAVIQSGTSMDAGIKSLAFGGKYVVSKTELFLWSTLSALADVLIALAMILLLRRANSKFSSFVLIRVVRLTIETNTLTASLAIASLVLYVAFPNKLYYVFITEIIGKVYANTLLVNLNNRIYFRDHQPPGHGESADIVSNRVCTTAQTSLRFAISEPDSFQLCSITQTVELETGEGDDTILNLSQSRATKCHLCPDDPESMVDNFPPRCQ